MTYAAMPAWECRSIRLFSFSASTVHLARYGDISPPANGAFNLLEQKGYVVVASACVVQQLCAMSECINGALECNVMHCVRHCVCVCVCAQ